MVEVEGRKLKLTNLDKILYPKTGFTKVDDVLDRANHNATGPRSLCQARQIGRP